MAEITHTSIDPENGHELNHYKSGAIYDKTAGLLVAGPTDPALNPIIGDPKRMRQRRREISEQQTRDAIDSGIIKSGLMEVSKMGTGAGWFYMIEKTVEDYIKTSSIKSKAELLKAIGQAAGYISSQRVGFEAEIHHTVSDAATELIKALNEAQQSIESEAVDGKVIE